ncbi:arsenate reductase family protein [Clostridium sp. 1001271B_151109_B4]|uniref:arsenate reductase family protein n=1 Tax=Clostridium sp. 1001271B_151109_B4 TaxID=2787148 RepID=UPI0018A99199|nr:arsenate reductase family protein [Clostridium sp. 1001271B_151109_B4]
MKKLFIEYPKCTTCRKAKKFLTENNVDFEDRDIVLNNPTEEELDKWIKLSGLEIKKFFNTSGVLYREMNLKDKLKDMSQEEMIKLLASDGKLVKRPLLVTEEKVLVGFKEETYKEII